MWRRVELHVHTTASDGKGSPSEVVQAAADRGVALLAITDHHTLDGYAEARRAGRRKGFVVLPGVELDCPSGRTGVHLLAVLPPQRGIVGRTTSSLELDRVSDRVRGAVGYTAAEAVNRIHALGGLAIAAHVRAKHKGLLEECRGTVLEAFADACRLDALEISAPGDPDDPPHVGAPLADVPIISGSDAHVLTDFQDAEYPYGVGSRAFWADLRNATFGGLADALADRRVSVPFPWLAEGAPGRLDTLLTLDRRWVLGVVNDDPEHHDEIFDAVVDLLNGDGGHVLVGVRRRFNGATRGAQLNLSAAELHRLVADAVHPTPVLDVLAYRGRHGQVHELVVLSARNPGAGYERRDRRDAARAAGADRHGLEQLGVLGRGAFVDEIERRARGRALGERDLRAFFPYRDWFAGDRAARRFVVDGLVAALAAPGDPPHWLTMWAQELPQVRDGVVSRYRDLVRRDQIVAQRERLKARLEEAVARGELTRPQRKSVTQWWEQRVAKAGEPPADDGGAPTEALRRRAADVFGDSLAERLDREAQRARGEFEATLRHDTGAEASVVLRADQGEDVPWERLEELGIDVVLTGGAGDGRGGIVLTAPDPFAELDAPELIALWAAPQDPPVDAVPVVLRRCIEVARPVPTLRAIARLDRAAVEDQLAALADTGSPVHRRRVLEDLRSVLKAPGAHPPSPDLPALVEAVDAPLTRETLLPLAAVAIGDPAAARGALDGRQALHDALLGAARPGRAGRLRRPAIVLAGLLGDRHLREWWKQESDQSLRIALVDGLVLLGDTGTDVDDLLVEALGDRASVITRAARGLFARGPSGFEVLAAHLPADDGGRGRVLDGIAEVAAREPDLARALAARCADELGYSALHGVRKVDQALYLEPGRARLDEPAPATALVA